MSKAYIYGLFPIDMGWSALPLLRDIERKEREAECPEFSIPDVRDMLNAAIPHLRDMGCQDYDIDPDMRVMAVPDSGPSLALSLLWKTTNNGNCISVSPVPISWDEGDCHDFRCIEYTPLSVFAAHNR